MRKLIVGSAKVRVNFMISSNMTPVWFLAQPVSLQRGRVSVQRCCFAFRPYRIENFTEKITLGADFFDNGISQIPLGIGYGHCHSVSMIYWIMPT